MLVIRSFTNIGSSLALLLIVGQQVTAQTPLSEVVSNSGSTSQTTSQTLPQTTPDPAQAEDLLPLPNRNDQSNKFERAPNYLNPSGNPLIFPTVPDEVDIKTVQPISLNQAIELALQNNKDLQSARIQLTQRQEQLTEQRARLFPALDAQFNFSRDSSISAAQQNLQLRRQAEAAGQDFVGINKESTNATGQLSLTYNIYTGGERAAQLKRAEREIKRQKLEVERAAEEVRFQAADNYYQLQRRDAEVAIAQAAIEDATQSLRDAQLLEQAGLGTRFSVLQAEVDVARANQELTTAISNQRIARRTLVQLLSLGQKVELTAADAIREAGNWPISLEESIVLAYKNRSELEQQLVARDIGEQDRKIALSEIKPKVDFSANYEYADNFDDEISVVDGYSFVATARWRFVDGGRAFSRARQADRQIDLANNEFARIRNQVRLEVEQSYYQMVANQENIQTAALSVESATESLRLARLRFQAGVGTQTDVINSQRDLTDARSRYLQAIVDYNRSLNDLQRSVSNWPDGRLFELR
ncbi:transporter [Aphanothece hegewaldii CCALA 016]|uniref:Transporter n=1 Tax=Aphanothece hegewaldii CCALA 016 TaxID=2107694 RepID=A0A2T1LXR3_9CHRO|nr:TolC family protein [Aphanothece hegewaldii]PSF37163.1 transporter [Aphanothece hegewaldii CCALA 016]